MLVFCPRLSHGLSLALSGRKFETCSPRGVLDAHKRPATELLGHISAIFPRHPCLLSHTLLFRCGSHNVQLGFLVAELDTPGRHDMAHEKSAMEHLHVSYRSAQLPGDLQAMCKSLHGESIKRSKGPLPTARPCPFQDKSLPEALNSEPCPSRLQELARLPQFDQSQSAPIPPCLIEPSKTSVRVSQPFPFKIRGRRRPCTMRLDSNSPWLQQRASLVYSTKRAAGHLDEAE